MKKTLALILGTIVVASAPASQASPTAFGTANAPNPTYLIAMKSWYNASRGDYYTTSSPAEETIAQNAGYTLVAHEGCVYSNAVSNATTPLYLMWHGGREDNVSAPSGSQTLTDATAAGYSYADPAVKAYLPFFVPDHGMLALEQYWNASRGDNALVATAASKSALVAQGYVWVRTEAVVYPSTYCNP